MSKGARRTGRFQGTGTLLMMVVVAAAPPLAPFVNIVGLLPLPFLLSHSASPTGPLGAQVGPVNSAWTAAFFEEPK